MRDARLQLAASDVAVIGVSPDTPSKQKNFDTKHKLGYPLLSDPEHRIAEAYGVWGEKKMYGKVSMGVIRSTVWVGPDGKVRKHWRKVAKAADHPSKVLELIQSTAG